MFTHVITHEFHHKGQILTSGGLAIFPWIRISCAIPTRTRTTLDRWTPQ